MISPEVLRLMQSPEALRARSSRRTNPKPSPLFDPAKLLDEDTRPVWNNGTIPVALRLGGRHPVRLRTPFASGNRAWLKNQPKNKEPQWNKPHKCWELPPSRFNELIAMVLTRFGAIYILQPCREKEVCAPACWDAKGFECQCSCLGAHHGRGHGAGWFVVSETFAVRYGEEKLGCRLLRVR
jgi:hypothetical protein